MYNAYPYPTYAPQQQFHPSQQVIKVNGKNGANTYQMPPNSSALLLDESAPIVWLAQTDGAGYKTITAYDISPHQEVPQMDLNGISDEIKKLESRMIRIEEALRNGEPNTSDAKWKSEQNKSAQTSNANRQSSK